MTALKSIIAQAKKLRKASPKMEWKTAVKKAGAMYRASAKKKPVKKSVKKTVKRIAKKPAAAKVKVSVGAIPKSVGFSVSGASSMVKKSLILDIGKLEAAKFVAKKKTDKRKIAKKIAEKKRVYRKFS